MTSTGVSMFERICSTIKSISGFSPMNHDFDRPIFLLYEARNDRNSKSFPFQKLDLLTAYDIRQYSRHRQYTLLSNKSGVYCQLRDGVSTG